MRTIRVLQHLGRPRHNLIFWGNYNVYICICQYANSKKSPIITKKYCKGKDGPEKIQKTALFWRETDGFRVLYAIFASYGCFSPQDGDQMDYCAYLGRPQYALEGQIESSAACERRLYPSPPLAAGAPWRAFLAWERPFTQRTLKRAARPLKNPLRANHGKISKTCFFCVSFVKYYFDL